MMDCEPCICLPVPEGDCLQTLSSDTNQLSLLSGINTAAKSCESEPKTDGSLTCTCGRGTSDCSIHPNTRDEWIASMQASLARICQSLENNPALAMAQEAVSIGKSSELLAIFDPASSSLKMSQQSLLMDSNASWPTWPRSGMTVAGRVYALPNVVANIQEIDGGLWPTPRAQMGKHGICWSRAENGEHRGQLEDYLAHLYVKAGGKRISGLLIHPSFCERLMRWPMGFTACMQSETDKMHSKRRSPGKSSLAKSESE